MERWNKKEDIILKLEELNKELDIYFMLWKKTGGGTTGHAIGCMKFRISKLIDFFDRYC